jgi:hypothetical protein
VSRHTIPRYFSLTPDDTERLERQLDDEERSGAAAP